MTAVRPFYKDRQTHAYIYEETHTQTYNAYVHTSRKSGKQTKKQVHRNACNHSRERKKELEKERGEKRQRYRERDVEIERDREKQRERNGVARGSESSNQARMRMLNYSYTCYYTLAVMQISWNKFCRGERKGGLKVEEARYPAASTC